MKYLKRKEEESRGSDFHWWRFGGKDQSFPVHQSEHKELCLLSPDFSSVFRFGLCTMQVFCSAIIKVTTVMVFFLLILTPINFKDVKNP